MIIEVQTEDNHDYLKCMWIYDLISQRAVTSALSHTKSGIIHFDFQSKQTHLDSVT